MTVKSIPKQYLPVKDETEEENITGMSAEKQQILLNKLLRRKLHKLQDQQHRAKDNLFLEISQPDKNNTMMLATGNLKTNDFKTTVYPQTDSDQFYESRVLKEAIKPAEGEVQDKERGPSIPQKRKKRLMRGSVDQSLKQVAALE